MQWLNLTVKFSERWVMEGLQSELSEVLGFNEHANKPYDLPHAEFSESVPQRRSF
jgi:hypothetical protein